MLFEIPQRTDPMVKMAMAEENTRRVPYRSAIQPPTGMKTARLKVELERTAFMLRGATLSASAIAGTAVFRMVVSSASMKTAMATSHGKSLLTELWGESWGGIG